MKILVINSGSSSIKFKLVNKQDLSTIVDGIIERIGTQYSKISYTFCNKRGGYKKQEESHLINSHREGFEFLVDQLSSMALIKDSNDLAAIGHHVVHGGEQFTQPVLITSTVIDAIRKTISLAPIHNPANLIGIDICRKTFFSTPQVAVFNTAFTILGRLDVLVFTAGIGENSPMIRLKTCRGLEHLGIQIDSKENIAEVNSTTEIQTSVSPVKILVIPTDEEMEIVRLALTCI